MCGAEADGSNAIVHGAAPRKDSAGFMDYVSSLQCGWVAIHVFGLVAACLVRVYAGTVAEGPLQGAFLMGLAGVAVATLAGEQFSWPLWTLSGATLGMMVVVAIADFRAQREPG
ncbi:MAG: hypothetical protein DCC67_04060 [Planctomycetota bacterium]|nr:MAG: hypothetical protein DCC67_04060 [Planctomycetota bacterium]